VTDFGQKRLLYVDIGKRTVRDFLQFAGSPFDFTLNAQKTIAFVCLVDAELVSVVDLAKKEIIEEIQDVPANPIYCAWDEDRGQLVVANWGGGESGGIRIVDLKTREVLKRIAPANAKASAGITLTTRSSRTEGQ